MALRTPALWMGNPAVQHTAQNDRLHLAGLFNPENVATAANRPLAGRQGVIYGPAGTMGEITLLSNTQFTVNPARWLVGSSASALGGVYEVTNDAVATLAITAQDATQSRRSYWGVWVSDSFVAGTGDDLPHWGMIDGALAASNPQLPAAGTLPANFLTLAEFTVPPVGQAVTVTPYIFGVRLVMRGGILPVVAGDTVAPAYDEQYRSHPTYGLQRGQGGVWGPPTQLIHGKMWRTAAFGNVSTANTWQRVWMQVARTTGGVVIDLTQSNAGSVMTLPIDGMWDVRMASYLSGGGATGTMISQVWRTRAAVADAYVMSLYDRKPDTGDSNSYASGVLPLKAGDKLYMQCQSPQTNLNYFGNGETQGVHVEALWVAPLPTGAVPV